MKTLAKIQLLIINYQLIIIGVIILIVNCQLTIVNCYAGPPAHSNTVSKASPPPSPLTGCAPGAAETDLDINNVRATMLTGGDYWWDFTRASDNSAGRYYVPANSGIKPIFAGAIWVGGVDQGKQLYLAGQEYRSAGNDWWPGPLDTAIVDIDAATCLQYDKHFKITHAEVAAFVAGTGPATTAIMQWPGNGNTAKGQAKYLAPYFDYNHNGIYDPNPNDGAHSDYPGFDLIGAGCTKTGCTPNDQLYGDESLWWVINDKGNNHTNTQGNPMGLEVHIQAFAFATGDEINDCSFYNYRIYNRNPTLTLDSTFIGIWCDPDLGGSTDDRVGCDVSRGLGFCYNGDNNDEGASGELGYGINPPAVGIDFFRGPLATDHKNNYNHTCPHDTDCEQILMSHFVYFTNGAPNGQGDPVTAPQYYQYMTGEWMDANPFTYGGTGHLTSGPKCAYCFPGQSDTYGWGVGGNCTTSKTQPNWTEETAGSLAPGDRRFLESAGPFILLPGAVNVITTGVVWARASSGGALASLNKLKFVDTKAQALFDNCFKIINGPDAPDLTIQELDKKLLIYISNPPALSTGDKDNNYQENYFEKDPYSYVSPANDTTWVFEGYQIYQLKDATVSNSDLTNADKARLVGVYDLNDGITQIINYNLGIDPTPNSLVPQDMVDGLDNGIVHSITITTDLFATGDPTIINHKTYYYMAVAYGYNPGENLPVNSPDITHEYLPYLQGRRNIKLYSATPHNPDPYSQGTVMNSDYGSGPSITRIEGNGNGGNVLDFTAATTNAILASSTSRITTPTYVNGAGPINVKVVDPLNVPVNNFTLKFDTLPIIASTFSGSPGVIPAAPAFQIGETVKGATSLATGTIIEAYNYVVTTTTVTTTCNLILHLANVKGTFTTGENVTGLKSGVTVKSIPKTVDNAAWVLVNNTTGDTIRSDKTIKVGYEQLLLQWGLSVTIQQGPVYQVQGPDVLVTNLPGDPGGKVAPNGFLQATMSPTVGGWLTGLANNNTSTYAHWIRSGAASGDYQYVDDALSYEGLVNGTWAPWPLCAASSGPPSGPAFNPASYYTGPGYSSANMALSRPNYIMKDLASVDVVFTSDQSKWTRAAVLEMCEDTTYSEAAPGLLHARKLDRRSHASVDKNGNPATIGSGPSTNPSAANYISDVGMGWFPGYAVNLETGERLNIAFGENSALTNLPGSRVVHYNPRAAITYTVISGAFALGETISDPAIPSTAAIVYNNTVTDSMVVQSSISPIISSTADTIYGLTSGAKAMVTTYTPSNAFKLGETITGTSGATGIITANTVSDSQMVIKIINGTFAKGDGITGLTSSAFAGITTYSLYNFDQNGADMRWNPTSVSYGAVPWYTGTSNPVFGGEHYIYVFGHNVDGAAAIGRVGRYDGGDSIITALNLANGQPSIVPKRNIFRDAIWVNIPLLASGHSLLESDVTVRLRVGKTYRKGYSTVNDTAAVSKNNNLPMYTFGTGDIATKTNDNSAAVSALDLINVVPNPYYAYSAYETNHLDNEIKITNLPEQCTISIYNLGGTLIARIKKGVAYTSHPAIDEQVITDATGIPIPTTWDGSTNWNLKNTAGTPIASGVYLIHIQVPGVGERILKWFGVMRPIDLGSF